MTTPNREYPKGALTGVAGSSARALQSVTQQDAINSLRAPVDESFSWFRSGVRSMLAGVVNFFGSALLGSWTTVRPEDIVVNDGQIQLNGRNDLLEGVRGYAAAYQSLNIYSGRREGIFSGGDPGYRFLPYNRQLGPAKGARIDSTGGIIFDEPGLWTVYVHNFLGDTSDILSAGSQSGSSLEPQVLTADGKSYSSLTSASETRAGVFDSHSVVFPVVIPEPGYRVIVMARAEHNRVWRGGTLYSRLAVVKHDNRVQNPGQQTVPDEK